MAKQNGAMQRALEIEGSAGAGPSPEGEGPRRARAGAEGPGGMPSLEPRVRLFRAVQGRRELLGFAELVIGGAFVIRDICIVRARDEQDEPGEPFVSFPSKRGTGAGEGRFFDVAHPVTAEARQVANEVILRAYREAAGAAI